MKRCNYCNIIIANYFKWRNIHICMNCHANHNVYCITCEESKPVKKFIDNSILPTSECNDCRSVAVIKRKCIKCKQSRPLSLYTHRSNAKSCDLCIVADRKYKCTTCRNMRDIKEFAHGTLRPCTSCTSMSKLVLDKIVDIDDADDSLTE